MPPLPSYLYQYPQSKNFFFRFRIPRQVTNTLRIKPFTFVASLQTANLAHARWFALYVSARIKKYCNCLINNEFKDNISMANEIKMELTSDELQSLNDFHDSIFSKSSGYTPKNWDFRAYLKSRFNTYLSMAKHAITTEREVGFDINKFGEVNNSDVKRYEEHLKSTLDTGNSNSSFEQLAHPHYLMAYLNDYYAFLKSPEFTDYNDQDIRNLSLNLNSDAENAFKRDGHGVDYFEMQAMSTDLPLDKQAINRFFARHAWLEFQFKRQLVSQLKEFSNSYDNFSDEEFESEDMPLTMWDQYDKIFPTYSDTLSLIEKLKREDKQTARKSNAIKLKSTFDKFIEDKSKEVKPDTVDQYKISFNFLFKLLGEDYDLKKLDKKQAVVIKDAVKNKAANSEKGRNEETLSVKTINRYLTNYDAFLTWCDDEELEVKSSLFTRLKFKETSANSDKRRPYTQDEIFAVVNYEPVKKIEAKDIREDAYWFPKIGLYTGMRLNEISYLVPEDFCIEDGIPYISLFDKDLKTDSSQRKIPIHSKLVKYGLLEFVEEKRQRKAKVLFEQSRKGKDKPNKYGWGEKVSRWYNRSCLRQIGIDKDFEAKSGYMVDFHGLRTTFISCCKRKGLSGYLVKQLVGHMDDDDITFGTYGSEVSTKLEAMQEVIEKIDY